MPKVSFRNKKAVLYGTGVVVALFAVLAPTLFYQPPTAQLRANGKTVSLQIASTEAARERGLGGRANMPADKGMLFVLDTPAPTCLWMKGMRFPLDMVWLNSAKQVIYLQQNVAPDTYPKNYCPPTNAKYIIELDAGQVARLGVRNGQTLKFQ